MTIPRSSASSATAGVGRTPASTALPPAETTPRAKASSSASPEPRVSRPTKTRPPPLQSVAALPSRSTRSSVRSSPTTPRTPSVPKYRLIAARLALRELRRLARLVQAGLLALDLARIACQEALALERHPQARVGLDERAGDPVANRSGLSGRAAPVDADAQVEGSLDPRHLERRERRDLVRLAREVVLDRASVHPGRPVARAQDHARDRRLALPRAHVLGRAGRRLRHSSPPAAAAPAPARRAGARGRRRP